MGLPYLRRNRLLPELQADTREAWDKETGVTPGRRHLDRVRARYQSGVPLFTRSAIHNLAYQLDRAIERLKNGISDVDNGEKISLQALDGRRVEIDNELGSTRPHFFGTRDIVM